LPSKEERSVFKQMIFVKTPLRISFLGGGTDHPEWFRKHGGSVLSTTIDKYAYLYIRRLPDVFDFNYRIAGKTTQEVHRIEEIQHPVIREALRHANGVFPRIEIMYASDLPSRSGMGSSSAFTVALLHGLAALRDQPMAPGELADEAISLEREWLKETVGYQDQIAAAFGGFNCIVFPKSNFFTVEKEVLPPGRQEDLESHLMLFYTGMQRNAHEIEKAKLKNYSARETDLEAFTLQVNKGRDMLRDLNIPIDKFGNCLSGHWMMKKRLDPCVTNTKIDEDFDRAVKAGASGGKLLGAGGGGFLLFVVKPVLQNAVREALRGLKEVSFRFSNAGSNVMQII
jgi:D-glycero-alpha-D-manno-heptose-7-phosphate kinase